MISFKKCFFVVIGGLFFSGATMAAMDFDSADFDNKDVMIAKGIDTSFKELPRHKQFEFFTLLETIDENCGDSGSCMHSSIIRFIRYSWCDLSFFYFFGNINLFFSESVHKPWGSFFGWIFYKFSPTAAKNEKKIRILQKVVKKNVSEACLVNHEIARVYNDACYKILMRDTQLERRNAENLLTIFLQNL